MLTKEDLSEIRKIVREEVENESKQIQSDLTLVKIHLDSEINEVRNRVKNLEIKTANLETKIDKMHRELKEEIKKVVDFFDREHLRIDKRVKILETAR